MPTCPPRSSCLDPSHRRARTNSVEGISSTIVGDCACESLTNEIRQKKQPSFSPLSRNPLPQIFRFLFLLLAALRLVEIGRTADRFSSMTHRRFPVSLRWPSPFRVRWWWWSPKPTSLAFLPVADALALVSPPSSTTRRAVGSRMILTDQRKSRSFLRAPEFRTLLSASVVPELDDSFPDEYNSNQGGNNNNTAIPAIGDDSFPGYQDFELHDVPTPTDDDYDYFGISGYDQQPQKDEETIVNPFPFPEPTHTQDFHSVASSEKATFSTPYSVPEPVEAIPPPSPPPIAKTETTAKPTAEEILPVSDQALGSDEQSNESDPVAPRSSSARNIATENIKATTTPSIGTPGSAFYTKNSTGTRGMSTVTGADADESPSKPDVDEFSFEPPHDLPEPVVSIDDADQAAFAPFASIMEDSGPVKPLVAPLKLSSIETSKAAAKAVPSIEANSLDDLVESLQGQLQSVEHEIESMSGNNADGKGKKINLNSPKQVSQLLFGQPDMSTNKSTLEGMAGSNILAKLILEYRDVKRRLNKVLKQQEERNAKQDATNQDAKPAPPPVRAMKDPVLLFDTSSFIFRAYYSNPPIHRGRDGMPTGAVMGFCSMLNKLLLTSMLKGETPILVHCLDAPGPTFRNDMYPDYKAHRPPIPLDLVPQFDLINRAARAYGMIQIQASGFEADDVIASLATMGSQEEGLDVKILSGDKDLMQLITEDDGSGSNGNDDDSGMGVVCMVDPMTTNLWTHETVLEKWGVKASQLGDLLALAGDTADNVPGVPGIGTKIAAQLLQEFGTLESLLENTDRIPQPKRREKLETNVDSARISRKLVELERSLKWSQMQIFHPPPVDGSEDSDSGSAPTPVTIPDSTKIGDLRMQPIQPDRILAFYDEMGFNKIKNTFLDRLGKIKPDPKSSTRQVNTPEAAHKEKPEAKQKPKAKTSNRKFWEKKKRGIPKPEDYKDVPF